MTSTNNNAHSYAKLPSHADKSIFSPLSFRSKIPESKLQDFKTLIKLAPIGPPTWENSGQGEDRRFGISREWLENAKKVWVEDFDWKQQEEYIAMFPQYVAKIKDDDGTEFEVHFMALFSQNEGAIPIGFYHGWPGSFLEFYGVLQAMTNRYTPDTLPYHCIVPSLTGYGFSSGPPLNKDWKVPDTARLMHKLMMALGFKKTGYAVQGGDVGAGLSRVLADQYDECKAIHLNFDAMGKPEGVDDSEVEAFEWEGLGRAQKWQQTGVGYAVEHGTRPATIGLVLSSSPIALLAWIGEKYREWSDEDPSLEEILRAASLYWLTESFPRSIYPYRAIAERMTAPESERGKRWGPYIKKPYGFSYFPKELVSIPKAWVKAGGNMVWHRRHETGGHFAALEKPEELCTDVEDFLKQVWKK